ncbi:MAG: Hpt domain-containing protein [Deltaproteobacteria bacterium]|nr:Hpt domain-containing protein [Deltaproteobacteria bacterium]
MKMASRDLDTLDLEALLARAGDLAFALEILQDFLTLMNQTLPALRAAAGGACSSTSTKEERDAHLAELCRLAHRLGGALAAIGANAAREAAELLETSSKDRDASASCEALRGLEYALEDVTRRIHELAHDAAGTTTATSPTGPSSESDRSGSRAFEPTTNMTTDAASRTGSTTTTSRCTSSRTSIGSEEQSR